MNAWMKDSIEHQNIYIFVQTILKVKVLMQKVYSFIANLHV